MAKKGLKRYRATLASPYRQDLKRFDINVDEFIYTWAYSKPQAIRNFIIRLDREGKVGQEFFNVMEDPIRMVKVDDK